MLDIETKLDTLLKYMSNACLGSRYNDELVKSTSNEQLLQLFEAYNKALTAHYNGRADAWNSHILRRVISEIQDGKVMTAGSTFTLMCNYIKHHAATA